MDNLKTLLAQISELNKNQQDELFTWLNNILHQDSRAIEGKAKVLEFRKAEQEKQKLICIHCNSDEIIGHGISKQGVKRYRCKSCQKTFCEVSGTTVFRIRSKDKWLNYIDCLMKGYSLRKSASQVGITLKTAFDWRHKILKPLKDVGCVKLEGIIESDETFFLYSEKGNKKIIERRARKRGGSESKDGIHNGHVSVLISADRSKSQLMNVAGRGRLTKKAIHEAAGKWFSKGSILVTDSHRNFHFYAKDNQLEHKRLFMRKKEFVKDKIYHVQNANNLHRRFKQWISRYNGVASKYLQHYVDLFRMIEKFKASRDLSIDMLPYTLKTNFTNNI
jgi:transposase-like protein